MPTSSYTRTENEQLSPLLSIPFLILPTPLILHLHYQTEESQCIGCSLFRCCAKPLIVFITSLCVSSIYILSEMRRTEFNTVIKIQAE